ncbi:DUF2062 domain-containing protein [Neisseria leonii]|uniref:DUF2062 domain-containing protein n=1 Tax=Neisseria leonii TaxID=2995413 RepID=A0A9X4IA13_9NEIS|nr:DUF2062 domain-containing protein [Neisseria sp. 51.81]MDD9326904.1 DUF2062 domain-containing protein [Neisseria sp. 51.81]
MKKDWLHSRLPDRRQIFASRWLKPLAPAFDKPHFWAVNRRSVALSAAIGLFCGLMPGPSQMLSALLAAYLLRTNLPVAVFTTLYTNPLTYMPLYYLAYRLGCAVLGIPADTAWQLPDTGSGLFWHEAAVWLGEKGKPLLIGVPLLGAVLAVSGYMAVRLLWRINSIRRWRQRGS